MIRNRLLCCIGKTPGRPRCAWHTQTPMQVTYRSNSKMARLGPDRVKRGGVGEDKVHDLVNRSNDHGTRYTGAENKSAKKFDGKCNGQLYKLFVIS